MYPNGMVGGQLRRFFKISEEITVSADRLYQAERKYDWDPPAQLVGPVTKPLMLGRKDVPRPPALPSFKSIRADSDAST